MTNDMNITLNVGDLRWRDTGYLVFDKVSPKDYDNWVENNAEKLDVWNGAKWVALHESPNLLT